MSARNSKLLRNQNAGGFVVIVLNERGITNANYQPHPSALGLIPSNGPRGRLRASAKSLFWVTVRKFKKKSERLVISPTIACQIHTANPRVLTLGRRGLRFLWKQLPLFLHMEGGSNALGITNKFLINCSQNDRK